MKTGYMYLLTALEIDRCVVGRDKLRSYAIRLAYTGRLDETIRSFFDLDCRMLLRKCLGSGLVCEEEKSNTK